MLVGGEYWRGRGDVREEGELAALAIEVHRVHAFTGSLGDVQGV